MTSRQFVALLAIVLIQQLSTIATASAAATQDSGIPVVMTVYAPGQPPVTDGTTIGALEQSCPTSTVDPTLYGSGGASEPGTQPSAQEWALATVLTMSNPTCLPTPIPISSVTQVTVLESDGQPDLNPAAQLTAPDLTLPSDFADSSQWPVFWDAGDAVIYERPSRGPNDDNAADQVIVVPGQSLQFDVFEGASPVSITITASATSVVPGSRVTFTASAPGGGSGGGDTFAWDFDGAAPAASGSQVSATFASAGVYEVTVQAMGAEEGFGQIAVAVGSTPAGTGTTTTPTGPVNGSGTSQGAATHRRKPKRKRKPTSAAQTTTPLATAHATTPAPASAPSGTAVTTTTTTTATPGTGSAGTVSGPPVSGPAATVHRSHTVVVQGRLLGSVVVVAGRADGASASGQTQRINRPAGSWPWATILGGLAVVALLALGAGRELRLIRWAP